MSTTPDPTGPGFTGGPTMSTGKPPLGLIPRRIYEGSRDRQRLSEIHAAMERYADAGLSIPRDWEDERTALAASLGMLNVVVDEVREAAIEHMAITDPVTLTAADLRCPVHGIPDCSLLLNGCRIPVVIAGRIHAVVERTRAADAFKAPEPHAYAVEVLCNPDSTWEVWRLDDEGEQHPEREDADTWLEEQHEAAGYPREHLRLVAITVVPS